MKTKDIVFELIRYRRMLEKQGVQVNAEVFDSAISALKECEWIPCSETIDIPDYEVMACDKYGNVIIGYLHNGIFDKELWICESDSELMNDAIAWRNLPKTYKGD